MINRVFLDAPYFWTDSDKAMSQGFDRLDPVKKTKQIVDFYLWFEFDATHWNKSDSSSPDMFS